MFYHIIVKYLHTYYSTLKSVLRNAGVQYIDEPTGFKKIKPNELHGFYSINLILSVHLQLQITKTH